MKRKIVALFMTMALMAGTMAGCGNSDAGGSSDASSDAGSTAQESSAESAEETEGENSEESEAESEEENQGASGETASSLLTEEPVTITFMRGENSAIPVQDNVASTRQILERTGIDLDITAVPGSDYNTKMTALYAANDMPDIFFAFNMTKREMVEDGALLALSDLIDEYAPNIKAYYDENPYLYRTMVDGEIYSLPQKRVDQNLEAGCVPFIRMDLLEDAGLPVPTTWKELAETLVTLTEKYNMEGWAARGSGRIIGESDYSWLDSFGASFSHYTDKDGTWHLGMIEDKYKDAVLFLKDLVERGGLDEEWLTTDTAGWQEKLGSGNYLFWYDNPTFASGINTALSAVNPDARFAPLELLEDYDGNVFNYKQPTHYTDTFYISADVEDPVLLIKFLDWCYSDEGAVTFGYGREGETYYLDDDGNPQWLPEILEKYANAEDGYYQASSDMGVNNGYFCPAWMNLTIEVFRASSNNPDELTAQYIYDFYEEQLNDGTIVEKTLLPPMTVEQDARIQEIKQAVQDTAITEFSKFVMGQRPIEEYDAFIEELKGLGAQEWADILNEAETAFQETMEGL